MNSNIIDLMPHFLGQGGVIAAFIYLGQKGFKFLTGQLAKQERKNDDREKRERALYEETLQTMKDNTVVLKSLSKQISNCHKQAA